VLNAWLGKDRSGTRDPNGKPREAYEFFDVMFVEDYEWAEYVLIIYYTCIQN
jgi:hypothetical protein